MGYHIILRATVKINPEYAFLFEGDHDFFDDDFEVEKLPTPFRELIEIWQGLGIGSFFYKWSFEDNIFKFEIQKKPYKHHGFLENDYKQFMKKVILPMSYHIENCEIKHDDNGNEYYSFTEDDVKGW